MGNKPFDNSCRIYSRTHDNNWTTHVKISGLIKDWRDQPNSCNPQTVQLCWCSSDSSQCALFIACLIENQLLLHPSYFHQSGTRCCLVSNLCFFPSSLLYIFYCYDERIHKKLRNFLIHCYAVGLYFALERFQSMLAKKCFLFFL